MSTVLIATAARPMTPEKAVNFNEIIRQSAAEAGMFIPQGIWWTHGPGCANLAFVITGKTEKEHEGFAKSLTMHLGIAKWQFTTDACPNRDQYDFDESEQK